MYSTMYKDILGNIWASNDCWDFFLELTDLENRSGGSVSEKQAASLIEGRMNAYGLKEVRQETFPMQGWERGKTLLRILSPSEKELAAIALPYSPAKQVTGELISLGDGLPEDFSNADIKGKIVIVTSETPSYYERWIHRGEKYSLAAAHGAAGFIFMNHYPGGLPATGSLRSNKIAEIPAVGISKETGTALLRQLEKGKVSVELDVRAKIAPATSQNVIGVLNPASIYGEILLGAHYDGHDIAQGALDNGAGITVLVELARVLAPWEQKLDRKVIFAGFGSEELGLIGSNAYANEHDLSDLVVVANLDGPGRARNLRFHTNGFNDLGKVIADLSKELHVPLQRLDKLSLHSDHWPFIQQGIPGFQVQPNTGTSGRGWGHTPADTQDKVDIRDIKGNAAVLSRLVLKLANKDTQLKRKTSEEIQRAIEKEHLEKAMEWL